MKPFVRSNLPDRQRIATLRRRATVLITLFLLWPLLLFLVPEGTRLLGSRLPAGSTYRWNDGTIYARQDATTARCTVTDTTGEREFVVWRDTRVWLGIDGTDITATGEATLRCTDDVTVLGAFLRILTYPIRFWGWVGVVWPFVLLFLFVTAAEVIVLERRVRGPRF